MSEEKSIYYIDVGSLKFEVVDWGNFARVTLVGHPTYTKACGSISSRQVTGVVERVNGDLTPHDIAEYLAECYHREQE